MRAAFVPPIRLGYEDLLPIPVQAIKVDIGKNRTDHTALRIPAMRGMPGPMFQVARRQHLLDQPEEAVIMEPFCQDRHEHAMVKLVKTLGDISLDKPFGAGPATFYGGKCRVAPATRSETVRMGAELRVVIRLKNGAHHFPQELIRPTWHAQGPNLPVFLRDIDSAGWSPSVAFEADCLDDAPDLFQ